MREGRARCGPAGRRGAAAMGAALGLGGVLLAGPAAASWLRVSGGAGDDHLLAGLELDGGFVLVGAAEPGGAGAGSQAWSLKLSADGVLEWEALSGGEVHDEWLDAAVLASGDSLLAGATQSWGFGEQDARVARLDPSGELQGDEVGGRDGFDGSTAVTSLPSGGALIAAHLFTAERGAFETWLTVFDEFGERLDEHLLAGAEPGWILVPNDVIRGGGEEILVVGSALDTLGGGSWQGFRAHVDLAAETVTASLHGLPGEDIGFTALTRLAGGDLIVAGTIGQEADPPSPGLLARLGPSVTPSWALRFDEAAHLLALSTDAGGRVVGTGRRREAGAPASDAWFAEVDATGALTWERGLGGDGADEGLGVLAVAAGGWLLVGTTGSLGAGGLDGFAALLEEDGTIPDCDAVRDVVTPSSPLSLPGSEFALVLSRPSAQWQGVAAESSAFAASVTRPCGAAGCTDPPPEVASQSPGDGPLQVSRRLDGVLDLSVDEQPEAEALSVLAGSLGEWDGPTATAGTTCHLVDWSLPGDGRLHLTADPAANSWFVVTASNACGESPAGPDSRGSERSDRAGWTGCGASP